MIKQIFFTAIVFLSLAAFAPAQAQKNSKGKSDVKFLDDISVEVAPTQTSASGPKAIFAEPLFISKKTPASISIVSIETANTLQFKYALLMDMEVEEIKNIGLFKAIDLWLGTRYKFGGSTKSGIDCSAFMQTLFTSVYGITLPRTAREQYGFTRRISRAELKEGDLVFFNTIGGVSHVGMYLQNNKFVHASTSGVTISDLYDDYYSKKFIGGGRIDDASQTATLNP
jgi:lipoprotein Spr